MELDKRIINGKRPLTCFDVEEAEKYIGKLCYMCDEYDQFHQLNLIEPAILMGVEDCEIPFHTGQDKQVEFCLPCDWVTKEKKYRPYTFDEFLDRFHFGEGIVFRNKARPNIVYHVLFMGYLENLENGKNEMNIILGQYRCSLQELFSDHDCFYNGRWVPFGVEE